jgi:hypothetical protein
MLSRAQRIIVEGSATKKIWGIKSASSRKDNSDGIQRNHLKKSNRVITWITRSRILKPYWASPK